MAGLSRPKDGVASLAYVPAIHVSTVASPQDVDARNQAGHDEAEFAAAVDACTLRRIRSKDSPL